MNTNRNGNVSRTLVFTLALLASATCSAWHGGGYYHGGGYHGDAYHGGYYNHGGWGGGWGGVSIGIPLGGYYGASNYGCSNVQVCNNYGNCWIQQQCN